MSNLLKKGVEIKNLDKILHFVYKIYKRIRPPKRLYKYGTTGLNFFDDRTLKEKFFDRIDEFFFNWQQELRYKRAYRNAIRDVIGYIGVVGYFTAIFVGFLMITSVVEIDFNDLTEAIPAYLCLLCMPLMYSISEGIAIGVISYVVINLICGKTKKITPLMYVLAVLFVCKYIFCLIQFCKMVI